MLDCSLENDGCLGGDISLVLQYVANNGINDDLSYPYDARGKEGKFRFRTDKIVIQNKDYALLTEKDELALKRVVANYGPVAVNLNAYSDQFLHYSSGVFYLSTCDDSRINLNFTGLVVGYGTDPKHGDYWLVVSIRLTR